MLWMIGLWVILFLAMFLVWMYNRLVKLRNNTENSFADVDVQMKNRFDLVENLVNTVKGYATHEKELLENVTKSRTNFMNAKSNDEKMEADNMLAGTLKSLFAVAENYPDLKANQNFMQLQTELSDLENKIAAARRYYNSSIKEYDNALETFPSNIVAWMFGFQKKTYFELTNEEEKKAPKVNF